MTKTTKLPETQHIIFCPGCSRKRPENREEAIKQQDAGQGDCCNPKCQGEWETSCYHCHHPSHWPGCLYKITAKLKGKKATRTIISFMRQYGDDSKQALLDFTTKLKSSLLVEHGMHWYIEVQDARAPEHTEKVVAAYNHYARGATVYHDPISTPEEPKITQIDTAPKEELVTKEPKQTPVPDSKPKPETRMSREAALEALRTYVSQQVEYETIDIIQMIISELAANPGGHQEPYRRIKVQIGQVPLDNKYNDVLEHAQALELGQLVPPAWLSRFDKLIAEIRAEFNLHEPVATPMPGEPPTNV